jgi:hypothetical protein
MKQYLHIIGPLALWGIALALFIITMNNDIPKRVDSIKTYDLQKRPKTFVDAWSNIKDIFIQNWGDDACFTGTNATALSTPCVTARSAILTGIQTQLDCTKYTSQACKCVSQVLKGVWGNSSALKNVANMRGVMQYSVESCRWLMHNAHIAVSTKDVWIYKTGLLLLLTTLVTGNAFDLIFADPYVQGWSRMSRFMFKVGSSLLWGFLAFIIMLPLDTNAYWLILVIMIPPIIILFIYEFYLATTIEKTPFLHPYFFAAILSGITILAHVEMGVLDYSVLIFEITKGTLTSFIYLQVVWRYLDTQSHEVDRSKFVEDGALRSVLLVTSLYTVGLMAPYTKTCDENFMWFTPLIWVLFAFGSVTWIANYRYDELFARRNALKRSDRYTMKGHVEGAKEHSSTIQMIFIFVLVLYYLREHSSVHRALVDNFPLNSPQYNTSWTWQRM